MSCTKTNIKVFDLKGKEQKTEFLEIDWDTSRDGKGKYPFYMEKEIMEQPEALQATLDHRIVDGHIDLSFDGVPDDVLQNCERICVVACGTAMHGRIDRQSDRSVKITNADGCRVCI